MIKQLALALVLGAGSILSLPAQSYYDDDIYYNADKVKKENEQKVKKAAEEKAKANYVANKSVDYPGADTYTILGDTLRDVDEYNRRTPSSTNDGSIVSGNDSFEYTRKIEKFYNPTIVDGSNDEVLQYLYYTSEAEREQKENPTQVNIYIDSPWGWTSAWPYYSSYAWGPSWAWNSWYGWTYPSWSWYWGPSVSWSWNWGWGPSWGWRPAWNWAPPRPPVRPGWNHLPPNAGRPQSPNHMPMISNRRQNMPGAAGNLSLGARPSRPTSVADRNLPGSSARPTGITIDANNIRRNSILQNTRRNTEIKQNSSSVNGVNLNSTTVNRTNRVTSSRPMNNNGSNYNNSTLNRGTSTGATRSTGGTRSGGSTGNRRR